MKYLLDTNIISALVIQPRSSLVQRISEVGEQNVFTSVIVSGEIAFGVTKRGSQELTRKVGNVLSKIYVASFEPPAERAYAHIRWELHKAGTPIGWNDLWIAAHALALDAVLVTDNEREFSRVAGLKLENWLRDAPAAN